MKRPRTTEKNIKKWISLYKQGFSTWEIASRYGVLPGTVFNHLKPLGVLRSLSTSKIGEKNGSWKGKKVGRIALHEYVRNRFPKPKKCTDCKKKKAYLDLANISQKYKREISDWEWLCRKCHMKKDGRLKKFINRKRSK